ncbi:class I SAM-dependent methyltransferase [Bradyrhizobium sp. SZCCHNRI3037]|uniref:class I SAM-dependent methyltransferase n=1 Tax=Bradyrhizobium sp. SZCCHNRI3037 TaxID=3057290 RepID=UPI00291679CF|nr:methyltransferase domain-containing protein [Bradyrhizobium sp. SZCCHNRI3037]
MLKLDLGCGRTKAEGFCGVDRFAMPGVDVVADLDKELPFPSDSASLVYASHSLEHVKDLSFTIREIYRIMSHGAQLCIVAPYHEQKLNLANPYHLSVFNEHTPRFWTNYPVAEVDPEEYSHPHAKNWGLLESDNSAPEIDLRLVDMEFFYFPAYLRYSTQEKRFFRRTRIDVCDQVLYRLIAWKPAEGDDRPYSALLSEFAPFEPALVWNRRKADQRRLYSVEESALSIAGELQQAGAGEGTARRSAETESGSGLIDVLKDLVDRLFSSKEADSEALIMALRADLSARSALLEEYRAKAADVSDLIAREAVARAQLSSATALAEEYKAKYAEIGELLAASGEQSKRQLDSLRAEIDVDDALLTEYRTRVAELDSALGDLQTKFEQEMRDASLASPDNSAVVADLYSQITAYRNSRAQRIRERFADDGLWRDVSPAFAKLKAYSQRAFRRRGYRLSLSPDIRAAEYREYSITIGVSRLSAVELAIVPLVRSSGVIGIELVSKKNQIVAQSTVDLEAITAERPTRFQLPEPVSLTPGWALRVFARGVAAPVILYELVHPAPIRRAPRVQPFSVFFEVDNGLT